MGVYQKSELSDKQLLILQTEMHKKKRSLGIAYALLFFSGPLVLHQFYLKDWLRGISYMFLGFSLVTCMLFSVKYLVWVFLGILVIFWIWDVLTLSKQTDKANDRIEQDYVDSIKKTSI